MSGALLLSSKKEINIKEFYKKRVMKLLIPFFIWSIVYFILQGARGEYSEALSFITFINLFLSGEIFGRLWFFYSLLGLYIITPFVKTFVQNTTEENLKLFLSLWFVTTATQSILKEFFSIELAIDLSYVYGYIGYFILGYYLNKNGLSVKMSLLSTLTAISLLITIFGSYYMSVIEGGFNEYFYDYLSPNTIIISVYIFILANKRVDNDSNMKFLELLSVNSLGIYLIHTLSLGILDIVGINAMLVNPLIGVPVTAVIATIMSLVISIVIKKIPLLKRILL